MVSLIHRFGRRRVQERKGSTKVTLPREDLAARGIARGDIVPVTYEKTTGELSVRLDPHEDSSEVEGLALQVVVVGGSLGVTIPAAISDRHDLSHGDKIWYEPREDGVAGWRFDLVEEREVDQRVRA